MMAMRRPRRPDPRPLLDRGYICYPLSILACLALYYLLAGCSTMPPKEVTVVWKTPCTNGPEVKRIKFVDTNAPLVACIAAAPSDTASKWTIMALLGFPVTGCVLSDARTNYAEVYAALSPGAMQSIAGISTLTGSGERYVAHEVEHVFGMGHPSLLWFLDSCHD